MTELSDVDKSKINAETASVNKTKASKFSIQEIMRRVEKQDGVGLNPPEVWKLYLYIEHLEQLIGELKSDINDLKSDLKFK